MVETNAIQAGAVQTMQKLGELLVAKGVASQEEVDRGLSLQEKVGGKLGGILLRSGTVSENVLLDVLSQQMNIPRVDVTHGVMPPSEAAISALLDTTEIALNWFIEEQVVIWEEPDCLMVAAKDPFASVISETVRYFYPNSAFTLALPRSQDLDAWLNIVSLKAQQNSSFDVDTAEDVRQLRELAEEAPIVELVNNIMSQAVEQGASDIHIEPSEFNFCVRFRVDGVLQLSHSLPNDRFAAVVSRIKLMSNIDIAERRLPQDGRLTTRVSGREMDVRVSTLPGTYGESVVMRLLPKERDELTLERLGMLSDHLAITDNWFNQPHGIILVTGPTGSGKSTTLYAGLESINDGVKKIITVEDPVEFQVPNITQVQAHADIGLTFAAALRSILRQDPDVIMIGEIRDLETAEIAVQSSLTGHLVLSTLHTNDAISAFNRLIDMGIEPFLVASPTRGVQAQRLVRKVCKHCSGPAEAMLSAEDQIFLDDVTQSLFPEKQAHWLKGKGCSSCQGTGYQGRLGIYELVDVTQEMQNLITERADIEVMRALAQEQGYRTMRQDGMIKAWLGLTTLEEVFRVSSH